MSKPYKAVEALSADYLSPRQDSRTTYRDSADIVIVGNGIAGLTAALEARRLAAEARIVIITEQSHPTINTPTLKQFAAGKISREQLLVYPAGTEHAQQIHVVNAHVEKIKTQGKFVCLSNGQGFGYGSLLLATGSTAVGLPEYLPGREFDGVLTPHRLSDYLDLRRRLREVKEAAVIGGGIHAIETVMSLLHRGIRIHWFIRGEIFLPRMLDRPASNMMLECSRHAGAKVYIETEVVGIVGKVGAVAGVVTNHDQMIPCQMVLACTGTTPVTALAECCDVPIKLKHKQGILVDDQLRTSMHDIYAAGDVAALENRQRGVYERRAHWHAAASQGRVAAAIMTGCDELATPFGVPWHATDLGGLSLLTVGDPLSETEGVEYLTGSSKGNYHRISISDDRLIGYLSLGLTQPDSLAIKRLIDEELPIGDIKKALLKGEFDARQYFSQQRSVTLHTMVTTGKLAVPNPLAHVSIRAQSPCNTEPLLPALIAEPKRDVSDDAVLFQEAAENKGSKEEDLHVTEQLEEIKLPVPMPEILSTSENVFPVSFSRAEVSFSRAGASPAPTIYEGRSEFEGPLKTEGQGQESQQVKPQTPVISSFKSLMSKQLEPVSWIVPEILPEGLIALVGKQKIGKSWLGLALGLGVAGGGVVLGSNKVKRGDVLYLALEDNEHRLQARLGKVAWPYNPSDCVSHHSPRRADIKSLTPSNSTSAPPDFCASLPDAFEYATRWPRMNTDGLMALEAWIVSHPHARLIIIDSWIKVKPIASQRQQTDAASYEEDYEALTRLKHLADKYHVCILAHFHLYKAATSHPFEELSSTSAISACADGFLILKRGSSKLYATLSVTGRDYTQDVNLALTFHDGLWKILGSAVPGALSKERRAIIDVLNGGSQPMRPKEIALILGKRNGTIRKMLHEMKVSNLISATDLGYISLISKDVDMFNNGNGDNTTNGGNTDEDINVYGHWEYAKSY